MSEILKTLVKLDRERGDDIERWFVQKREELLPHFYTSVDLRHSGLRLAPVDTNLFPAGFNNISEAARARASRFIARFMEERFPYAKRVLIVPENHTRNLGYLENLVVLQSLFTQAGLEVYIGSLVAEPGQPLVLTSLHGSPLTQYPLVRRGNRLTTEDGFDPDVVVMNNDMTTGVPDIIKNLEQPVIPSSEMGWWKRRKSVHFAAYQLLAQEFSQLVSIDPWLISAEFQSCGRVDFKERVGIDSLARGIDDVLSRVRKKHAEYGIKDEPYVFVKADSGTYGMGIMTVKSADEILDLNKKDRNKMQTVKEGAQVGEIIIQEGLATVDRVDGKPAEPVVYMIDGLPVGGMYRVNGERDAFDKLNASGMEFKGMCDEVEDECGRWRAVENCDFRSFGIVAAIAALAAAREQGFEGGGI